jgi:PilZ domain
MFIHPTPSADGETAEPSTVRQRQEGEERRRHPRAPLPLPGRYMLENGRDYPCRTEDISATGILIRGLLAGDVGEWVVAHLSEIGRVEGTIVRVADGWFAFEISATAGKRQKLLVKIESCFRNGATSGG